MNYQTIFTIKASEKATVELAAVEAFVGPVIVKHLKGGKPEIYRLLANEKNSHIPEIYAVEEAEGELIVIEEYMDGESLRECLQKNRLSDEEKINYALQLCEAVGFLHTMNPVVIHRDIKPSNILINGKGELKLIDFDASRQYKETLSSGDTRLLGTVEYAPPEQFGYSQTDVRSDIYSMGVVLHEMRLTENKKLAEQWEKIAEKCTSFDPKNRYQSVAELKKELEKLEAWKRLRRKKLIGWSCAMALVCMAAALMICLWPKQNPAEEAITATPKPALMSSTELPDTNEIAKNLRAKGHFVNDYYKDVQPVRDFMLYSTYFEGEKTRFTLVELYNYQTEETIQVPEDCFYNENNILHIKNSYLKDLPISCYRVEIYYREETTGREGGMQMHVLLHEGNEKNPSAKPVVNDYLDFYYEYDSCIHSMLANDVDSTIAGIVVGNHELEACEESLKELYGENIPWLDENQYELSEDRRVFRIDYELLAPYMEPGEEEGILTFYIKLDDGRYDTFYVDYKLGIPPYAR